MKTRTSLFQPALLLVPLFFLLTNQTIFAQSALGRSQTDELNTVSLQVTSAQLNPDEGYNVIRAFVPTGSTSVNCLATLNEIRTDVSPAGTTMFCALRRPSAFGGTPGILISIFFNQTPPADLLIDLTLYQKGAKRYGAPVLCTGRDGC